MCRELAHSEMGRKLQLEKFQVESVKLRPPHRVATPE